MASLDGHLLEFDRSESGVGGVLVKPSQLSTDIELSDGAVSFQKGSRAAVAYVGLGDSPDDLLRVGYRLLQQALDLLAIGEGVNLAYDDLVHQHLLWWREDARGRVLRWSGCAQSTITTSVSWTVQRSDGTTEHSPELGRPAWAEAHRYFRKSQSAMSAGDAYRDMYLAMEQAMSFAEPHTSGGEGAWTRNALANLMQRGVQLGVYATSDPNPIDAFMNTFYDARNGHSHAKVGKHHTVPHDLAFHEAVVTDLIWLGQLTLHTFGVLGWDEGPFGGMVLNGIRMLNEALEIKLFVTEDSSPVLLSDTEISPAGRPENALETRNLGAVDAAGFDFGWLGQTEVQWLDSATVGRAVATVLDHDSQRYVAWAAENPPTLCVAEADVFEYRLVHVHSAVFGRIRRHYPQ